MPIDAGTAFSEAWERVTTEAALVLVGVYTAANLLQTAALQDITREAIEALREFVQEEGSAQDYRDVVDATDPILNDLPLALGFDLVPAILVFLGAVVLLTAVVVVAIDAFARGARSVDDLDTSRLLYRTLNVLVGGFVYFLLMVVGFALLVLPGLVVFFFLLYFPMAVVVDDENFVSAFSSSFATVRDNLLHTLLLVILAFVIGIGSGLLVGVVTVALPGTLGEIVSTAINAAVTVFLIGAFTRAYVAAHADDEDGVEEAEPSSTPS